MTDESSPACDEFSFQLAELALGILTGRDRAATLSHVESCPRCAHQLEELSRAADAVVQVAPDVEPPVGFEVRLFSRMGIAEVPPRASWRSRRMVPLAVAAAVVALVVGLSLGWAGGSHANRNPIGTVVASAVLTDHGKGVGHVYLYGGRSPWMSMTLADSRVAGRVTCAVITDNGVVHTVGSFKASEGYGTWGAPLRVAPSDVRTAEVVASNGTVIATAPLD